MALLPKDVPWRYPYPPHLGGKRVMLAAVEKAMSEDQTAYELECPECGANNSTHLPNCREGARRLLAAMGITEARQPRGRDYPIPTLADIEGPPVDTGWSPLEAQELRARCLAMAVQVDNGGVLNAAQAIKCAEQFRAYIEHGAVGGT